MNTDEMYNQSSTETKTSLAPKLSDIRSIFERARIKGFRLNNWESNFLNSVKAQMIDFVKAYPSLDRWTGLSDKQLKCLRDIEEKLWKD